METIRDPDIGKEIDGFRLLEVLGRGGMGVVYKAEDQALSRLVAIKMIDPTLARDDGFMRRFRSEARALARV
ncbi:MAG TPA: protein kinase, partial [Rhodothermales bacterium]|nr:protein kinase [Rhodothermales bacterium]